MIEITPAAQERFKTVLEETENPFVRLSIQGGGCGGFTYDFSFEDEAGEDDMVIDQLLIDFMSMQYLTGAKVDFVEDELGFQFKVDNPNAQTTCGCGSSFSV